MGEKQEGAFLVSLKRNNKQIREDRAVAISEDAQLIFKREVEDIKLSITRMKRDRDNMLDLAPDSGISLKVASDFNASEYVQKEKDLAKKLRDAEILFQLMSDRYTFLFGEVIA